jgi:hypothetical protein
MRFFLPSVPIFSQNDSSFSSLRVATGGRGDLGLGDAMFVFLLTTARPVFQTMNYLTLHAKYAYTNQEVTFGR